MSNLESLSKNLVEANGMMCEDCRSEVEHTHIDKNYITHGTCGKCQSTSHQKLEIDSIFNNLRVGHTDKQFQLLPR